MATEFNVPWDVLRKRKPMICTPMHDGRSDGRFQLACQNLLKRLLDAGISCSFHHGYGDGIARVRNKQAAEFLRSDATDMLFLDGDINFTADDVLVLLASEKEMIAAPYARKKFDWAAIKQAVIDHPDINPLDLPAVGCTPVLGWLRNGEIRLDEIQPVKEIGTGFLLVRRVVFERMIEKYGDSMRYVPMPDEDQSPSYDFFAMGKNPEPPYNYLSEDYFFQQRWRALGGELFVCPWMVTGHIGMQEFPCDLSVRGHYAGKV